MIFKATILIVAIYNRCFGSHFCYGVLPFGCVVEERWEVGSGRKWTEVDGSG